MILQLTKSKNSGTILRPFGAAITAANGGSTLKKGSRSHAEELAGNFSHFLKEVGRSWRRGKPTSTLKSLYSHPDLMVRVCFQSVLTFRELRDKGPLEAAGWTLNQAPDDQLWDMAVLAAEGGDEGRCLIKLLAPVGIVRLVDVMRKRCDHDVLLVAASIMTNCASLGPVALGEFEGEDIPREESRAAAAEIVHCVMAMGFLPRPYIPAVKDHNDHEEQKPLPRSLLIEPRRDVGNNFLPWPVLEEDELNATSQIIEEVIECNCVPDQVFARVGEASRRNGRLTTDTLSLVGEIERAFRGKYLRAWIPSGGRLKFDPSLAGCSSQDMGIQSLTVSPMSQVPSLEFCLRYVYFAGNLEDRWRVTPSGVEFEEWVKPGSAHEALRLILTLMCVREIHHKSVCVPFKGRKERSTRGSDEGDTEVEPWLRLRRLAEPWHNPSSDALARAAAAGLEVPKGYTTYGSPSIEAEQGKTDPPKFRTVKVSDEGLF